LESDWAAQAWGRKSELLVVSGQRTLNHMIDKQKVYPEVYPIRNPERSEIVTPLFFLVPVRGLEPLTY
jgi:hypothetical protein